LLVRPEICVLKPVFDASPLVFDTSLNRSGAAVVVKVGGEVDLATVAELERGLDSVLREPSDRAIVIDLEVLEFLAVCGVSALLAAKRSAEQAGRNVQVINARGAPARALRLLGFESWCKQASGNEAKAIDEPQ
jgi:anti-anti-sigma factor